MSKSCFRNTKLWPVQRPLWAATGLITAQAQDISWSSGSFSFRPLLSRRQVSVGGRRGGERGNERERSSPEGGQRAQGPRGRGSRGSIQRRRQLLPQLRQGPHDPPVEPSPRDSRQDLQISWPRSPRRPLHPVILPSFLSRGVRLCCFDYFMFCCIAAESELKCWE